jgi:hypothetical protein
MHRFYLDENVPRPIADGCRQRGLDVRTVQEDGCTGIDDRAVLDRAGELDRVLFTQDDDFLREATRRVRAGERFTTVIYAHQLLVSVGQCVDDLDLFARAATDDEAVGHVYHLPFR